MALTERLALLIDARTGGAVREIRKVQQEVGAIQTPVTRTDRALKSLGLSGAVSGQALKAGIATAAVAGAIGLGKLAKASVGASSALHEQATAAEVLFDGAAGSVADFADTASSKIGLSERAALQAANTFGTFFTNIGLGEQEAAKFSTGLTSLAADISSLKNISNDEAITKLTSGLAGEQRALRDIGIFMSEAAVKAKALELGFRPLNGQFSDQAKVLARMSLLLDQTGKAQGNFALTADDLANSQRTLHAEVENLGASLGDLLIPAVTETVHGLTDLVKIGDKAVGAFSDISDAAGGIPAKLFSFGPLGGILTVTSRVSAVMSLFGDDTDDASQSAARAKGTFASLAGTIPSIASSINETVPSVKELDQALDSVRSVFFASIDAQNAYDDALGGIDDASRAAAQAHNDLADAQEDQRRTIADLNIEVERNERAVTRSARAVMQAQRDLAEANEDLADAQADYGDVIADFSPNSRRAHDALENLEDAQRRQEDAQFSAEDAAYSLQDAQRALADTTIELRDELAGVGPAADRVRDAQDRVRESSGQLQEAQEHLGRAAVNLEIAQDNVRDAFYENETAVKALLGEFDELIAKYPGLATFFGGLKAEAEALNTELDKTRGVLEAITMLGAAVGEGVADLLPFIRDIFTNPGSTAHPTRPDPGAWVPPNSIGSTQAPGVQVGKGLTMVFNEKIDPMHAMREAKRQLIGGG